MNFLLTCMHRGEHMLCTVNGNSHRSCSAQVRDGPDDGEQHGAAACNVHDVQDVVPRDPGPACRRVLILRPTRAR